MALPMPAQRPRFRISFLDTALSKNARDFIGPLIPGAARGTANIYVWHCCPPLGLSGKIAVMSGKDEMLYKSGPPA